MIECPVTTAPRYIEQESGGPRQEHGWSRPASGPGGAIADRATRPAP